MSIAFNQLSGVTMASHSVITSNSDRMRLATSLCGIFLLATSAILLIIAFLVGRLTLPGSGCGIGLICPSKYFRWNSFNRKGFLTVISCHSAMPPYCSSSFVDSKPRRFTMIRSLGKFLWTNILKSWTILKFGLHFVLVEKYLRKKNSTLFAIISFFTIAVSA